MLTKKNRVHVAVMLFVLVTMTAYAGYVNVIESPFSNPNDWGGDFLHRGFYIENYGADNLRQVILQYKSRGTGTYNTSLTVRIGSYDGIIVGQTKTLSTYFEADIPKQVVYDFGGINVPYGSLLTFTQETNSGPDKLLYFNTGNESHPQITETNGTTAPLDSWRRDGVGVIITAIPEPATVSLLAIGTILAIRKRK